MPKYLWIAFFLASLIWACQLIDQDDSSCKAPPINPNGESEMALFMRRIAAECDSVKSKMLKEKEAKFSIDATQILKAKMTKGHSMDSLYIAYANTFIQQIAQFNTKSNKTIYNAIVLNCIACHKTSCPGPIDRIKKLKLPKGFYAF